MHVPSAEELAAIAAAYLVVTARTEPLRRAEASRWALAGRIASADNGAARLVARAASRWNAAGRLDG